MDGGPQRPCHRDLQRFQRWNQKYNSIRTAKRGIRSHPKRITSDYDKEPFFRKGQAAPSFLRSFSEKQAPERNINARRKTIGVSKRCVLRAAVYRPERRAGASAKSKRNGSAQVGQSNASERRPDRQQPGGIFLCTDCRRGLHHHPPAQGHGGRIGECHPWLGAIARRIRRSTGR